MRRRSTIIALALAATIGTLLLSAVVPPSMAWNTALGSTSSPSSAVSTGPAHLAPNLPSTISRPAVVPTTSAAGSAPAAVTTSPLAVHPAVSPLGALNWSNQTLHFDQYGAPYAAGGAAVAYDPLLGEFVMVGSTCGSYCASNATWVYDGGSWFNETSYISQFGGNLPHIRGPAVAWDPAWGGVIMTGGAYPSGSTSNQTWLFNGSWYNISLQVGTVLAPDTVFAPMTYDGAIQSLVLVDGCDDFSCSYVWNQTEVLGPPATGTWFPYNGPAMPRIWGNSIAYDPTTEDVVLYGGAFWNATNTIIPVNWTWTYNSTGVWENDTYAPSLFVCIFLGVDCYYPNAGWYSSMTWDGQIGEIVLFGGENASYTTTNDTFYFNGSQWFPLSVLNPNLTYGPPVMNNGAMDTNSSVVAPTLIGGYCSYTNCSGQSYVLEIPPQPVLSLAAPNPVDVNAPLLAAGYLTTGTGSGPWISFYLTNFFGNYSLQYFNVPNFATYIGTSATFKYAGPSTWLVYAYVIDWLGVTGFSNFAVVTVNTNISATSSANATATELSTGSASVTFTSDYSGGTGPYTFSWDFGDTLTSTAENVTHTYTAAGTYLVSYNVSDAGGGWNASSFYVTVYATITAGATPSPVATDVGLAVDFTGSMAHGAPGPHTFAWSFGDLGTATTQNATHTYAAAGTKSVSFTVTDAFGFHATAALSVVVNPDVSGTASASTTSPTTKDNVTFTATTLGGTSPYTYHWAYGDGFTATTVTAATTDVAHHTYGTAGTYTVTLTITDAVGNSTTKTFTVTASNPPSTSLLGSLTSGPGLYAIIIVIVVVVVALAALLLRRSRKSKGGAPPSPPPTGPSGPSTPGEGGQTPPSSPPSGGS